MENFTQNLAPILILLFLTITFIQSGLDKVFDWKGNLDWFKSHFKDTFMGGMASLNLGIITLIEVIAGFLSLGGIIMLVINGDKQIGLYGAATSALALCMLLFGQRIAKEYAGAANLVPYFIVAILGIFLLT